MNCVHNHLPLLNHVMILSFSDHKVEVVTCLERQNALISSCHDGLSVSVESIASSGHLGKYNRKKNTSIVQLA